MLEERLSSVTEENILISWISITCPCRILCLVIRQLVRYVDEIWVAYLFMCMPYLLKLRLLTKLPPRKMNVDCGNEV